MSNSDANQAPIYFHEDNDPEMKLANERARKTFRFFWRELSWEYRRIIPGLEVAAVKIPFKDPPGTSSGDDEPSVEQMWVNEVEFDGVNVKGTLLNSPSWLKSVSVGDEVNVPLAAISDWMYAVSGRVYGGYTVNLMRSAMSRGERRKHDRAWGLKFGNPEHIHVVPEEWYGEKQGFLARRFGKDREPTIDFETTEHPMSDNMAPSLKEQIASDAMTLYQTDDRGWTYLHQMALAGSKACVAVLLECGADPNVLTSNGMTPLQLANSLGWNAVADLLIANGAQ